MTHAHDPIDISHVPELIHLAEEIRQSCTPRVLRHADADVAVLAPLGDLPADAGEDVEALIARLHRNLAARTLVPLGTDTVRLHERGVRAACVPWTADERFVRAMQRHGFASVRSLRTYPLPAV